MGNVNQMVFEPFRAFYGDPDSSDPELYLDIYEELLQGFPDDVLGKAAKRVMLQRKYNGWPKPAEVAEACASIVGPSVHSSYKPLPNVDWSPRTEQQKAEMQSNVENLLAIIAQNVEDKATTAPKPKYYDRPAFEKIQRESPNIDLMMTEHGRAKCRETGRKPEHPKPKLLQTDTFKEMDRMYEQGQRMKNQ